MSRADRERWDARWRERAAPGEVSAFLRSLDDLLPRRGRALDVAGGAGATAAWLARRGLDVTLVDISEEALAIARSQGAPLRALALDLDADPLPAGPFDLVVCQFFLDRRLYRQFPGLLGPGGLVVIQHPTLENLARNPRPERERLLAPGELPSLLPGVEAIRYQEGWWEEGRHEARFVGRAAHRPETTCP